MAANKIKKGLAITVNVFLIVTLSLILLGMFAELDDRRNLIPFSYNEETIQMNLEDGDYSAAIFEAFHNNPEIYSEGYEKDYEAVIVYADAKFKALSYELAGDYVNAMNYDKIASDAVRLMGSYEYMKEDIDAKLKVLLEE